MCMLADPSWVFRQYDHQLLLNTVVRPGADAALLRLKDPVTGVDTGRALALTTDGNHRWCAADPRRGTAMVVAEAVLNLACVGAVPVALVNCLNFGNPEHPEVMWQLAEAIDGMADACRALGIPVVGGNVSLYNESVGRDIDPTPVVGLLGVVDHLERVPAGPALLEGGRVLLLGSDPEPSVAGSRWARDAGAADLGPLPPLDLRTHTAVAAVVRQLVADGLVAGVHDVADGGLGLAVAEMAAQSGVGASLGGMTDHVALFSEAPSRVLVCAQPDLVPQVEERARAAGVAVTELGTAGGDRLAIDGLVDLPVTRIGDVWQATPFPQVDEEPPASSREGARPATA
jgi:phosphoribosylformylglycinamidine synthase